MNRSAPPAHQVDQVPVCRHRHARGEKHPTCTRGRPGRAWRTAQSRRRRRAPRPPQRARCSRGTASPRCHGAWCPAPGPAARGSRAEQSSTAFLTRTLPCTGCSTGREKERACCALPEWRAARRTPACTLTSPQAPNRACAQTLTMLKPNAATHAPLGGTPPAAATPTAPSAAPTHRRRRQCRRPPAAPRAATEAATPGATRCRRRQRRRCRGRGLALPRPPGRLGPAMRRRSREPFLSLPRQEGSRCAQEHHAQESKRSSNSKRALT